MLHCTAGSTSAAPVQMLAADHTPIRAIAWQPHRRWYFTGDPQQLEAARQQQQQYRPQQAGSSDVAGSSQLFITASSNGNLKVWDVHDVLQACQERLVSRHAVNALLWLGPPHVWLTASADGNIRSFWVDAGVQATSIPQQNADGECLWFWRCFWGCAARLHSAYIQVQTHPTPQIPV